MPLVAIVVLSAGLLQEQPSWCAARTRQIAVDVTVFVAPAFKEGEALRDPVRRASRARRGYERWIKSSCAEFRIGR